jgi:hypothetical protein
LEPKGAKGGPKQSQTKHVEMFARNGHDTASAEHTLDLFTCTLNSFEEKLRRILATEESCGPF